MGIKVIGIFILLAGVAWLVWEFVRYFGGNNESDRGGRIKPFGTLGALGGVCLFVVGLTLSLAAAVVPAGHRGVVLMWGGQVEQRVLNEGLNFLAPFVESKIDVDVRVQAHEFKSIDAASKEMQVVKLTGNVNWHFDPAYVNWIYQNIGASKDFVDKILDKSLQDFLKEVTPKYTINEILPKRTEIRQGAVDVLSENLLRYHIVINDIYIADIQFSPEYLAAIEKQQVAERQVMTERNVLEQIKIKADQANAQAVGEANAAATRAEGNKRASITQAEGERQSRILVAQGESQAISTVAEQQAKANEMVNKTLTEEIIRYALVQKLGSGIKVVVLPSGENFILGPEILGDK